MFLYQTAPIDFFTGLVPVEQAILAASKDRGDDAGRIITLLCKCIRAISLAEGSFWEGDMKDGSPYLFGLPYPDDAGTIFGVVWKQENNGVTFICSPVELPWIDARDMLPRK